MGKAKAKTGRATGSRSLQGKGGAEAIKGKSARLLPRHQAPPRKRPAKRREATGNGRPHSGPFPIASVMMSDAFDLGNLRGEAQRA
jgi:hypothetical protein